MANNRRRKASRQRFLAALKATCGCVDCGTRTGRLDFDHRPGTTKEFNVAQGRTFSWHRLLAEIDKCDVRCVTCHAARHAVPKKGVTGWRRGATCKRGHDQTDPENVEALPSGKKRCKPCQRQRVREWRARAAHPERATVH